MYFLKSYAQKLLGLSLALSFLILSLNFNKVIAAAGTDDDYSPTTSLVTNTASCGTQTVADWYALATDTTKYVAGTSTSYATDLATAVTAGKYTVTQFETISTGQKGVYIWFTSGTPSITWPNDGFVRFSSTSQIFRIYIQDGSPNGLGCSHKVLQTTAHSTPNQQNMSREADATTGSKLWHYITSQYITPTYPVGYAGALVRNDAPPDYYDEAYQTTSTILASFTELGDVTSLDFTEYWQSILNDDAIWYNETFSATTTENRQQFLIHLNSIISGETTGSVSLSEVGYLADDNSEGFTYINVNVIVGGTIINWESEGSDTLPDNGKVYIESTGASDTVYNFNVKIAQDSGNLTAPRVTDFSKSTGIHENLISDIWELPAPFDQNWVKHGFVIGDVDENYPDGYDGQDIVIGDTPSLYITPVLQVNTNGSSVSATVTTYDGPIEGLGDCKPSFTYTLLKQQEDNNYVALDGYQHSASYNGTATFSNLPYHNYAISVSGNGWSCTETDISVTDNYEVETIIQQFPINGETKTYTSDCGTTVCTAPAPVSDFEDCSVHSLLSPEYYLCLMGNALKGIRNLAVYLFVPRNDFFTEKNSEIANNLNNNLSILLYPVTWFSTVVTDIVSQDENCTVVADGFYGATGSFDLCGMTERWPDAWDLSTLIARMALTMLFMVALYKYFENLWKPA